MESSDRAAKLAAERDALELLRTIREQLHTDFSDEDREILARKWTAVEEPKAKHKIPFNGSSFAMVYSVFDPNTLGVEARLVPGSTAGVRCRAPAAALDRPSNHEGFAPPLTSMKRERRCRVNRYR